MPLYLTCPICSTTFRQKPAHAHRVHCSASCGQRARFAPLPLEIDGETARIPLAARDGTIQAYAVIDSADADWAGKWRWHLDNHGYAMRRERGTTERHPILLHRALLGLAHGDPMTGDHIDGDRLNDRRANLRAIPLAAQSQNRRSHKGSSSRYRGVSWSKQRQKWVAYVGVNYKLTHLGVFDSEEEAARVASEARLRLHEYATH